MFNHSPVHIYSIDSKTIDSFLQPELHGMLIDGFPRLLVLPVQIRLLGTKQMKVILLCLLIPLPDTTSKIAHPIVWRLAYTVDVFCRPPNIPISFGIVPRTSALLKPFVLDES